MSTRSLVAALAAATLATVALAGAPAMAGLDVDFGAAISIGDDDDLFFTVAAHYYDDDKEEVRNLGYRYDAHPDDVAVALFISKRSGRSPAWVYKMRKAGHSWFQIAVRAGLQPDVFFVAVERDPGPPYGKAYGHWKKRKHNHAHRVVLTDADVRNLVAVRMVHEYYGVSVDVAMEWRASGTSVRHLMTQEYHRRHGKKHKAKHKANHAARHAKHHARHHEDEHENGRGKGKGKRD